LVDVAPTILELANVPAPADLDGVSLVPALAGSTAPPRTVFAERGTPNHPEGHRIAARTATAKWIGNPGALDEMEAYDLTADPAETTPITDPARLARGRALLERYLRRAAPTDAPTADEAEPLDESTQEKLRALGYLE
jgi:arylsulfatase A-like enzyme